MAVAESQYYTPVHDQSWCLFLLPGHPGHSLLLPRRTCGAPPCGLSVVGRRAAFPPSSVLPAHVLAHSRVPYSLTQRAAASSAPPPPATTASPTSPIITASLCLVTVFRLSYTRSTQGLGSLVLPCVQHPSQRRLKILWFEVLGAYSDRISIFTLPSLRPLPSSPLSSCSLSHSLPANLTCDRRRVGAHVAILARTLGVSCRFGVLTNNLVD